MRTIHLMDPAGQSARVAMLGLDKARDHRMGLPGKPLELRRTLAAGERRSHEDMAARFGADYGQALVDGDPEIDFEVVGRTIGHTDRVYLSALGEELFAPPKIIEVILAPDGTEKEHRAPIDTQSNVDEALPVRPAGKKIHKAQAVRQHVFSRTIQIWHIDGPTFDYLFALARELAREDVLMELGAGKTGREPLIFQTNGTPYRGFLEGRVDGQRYMLLLHLSNMELKRPTGGAQ